MEACDHRLTLGRLELEEMKSDTQVPHSQQLLIGTAGGDLCAEPFQCVVTSVGQGIQVPMSESGPAWQPWKPHNCVLRCPSVPYPIGLL